ncbi:ribonuclease H-like domain-containing protein [Tanacetum coccineum]
MVCGVRLALGSFIEVLCLSLVLVCAGCGSTKDSLIQSCLPCVVVRSFSTIEGGARVVCFDRERGYKGNGEVGSGRGELGEYLGGGFGRKTVGNGGFDFGGYDGGCRIPVNTASHNFNNQAVSTSAARRVNAIRPIMNDNKPINNFHKSHSPIRRPFNRTTTPRTNISNQKVNTAKDYPQRALKNKGIVDSGCSRHMTGNKAYLAKYQDYNGSTVAFGGSKGYITGKGKIKTRKLDFEDVCFVKELQHFNLFSMSQMCDKKNKVFFIDTKCLVLSSNFKLPDENQVLLKIPRQNNMYSFNIENIIPSGGLACLITKATFDESNKWHRRDIIEFCGSKGIKREYSNTRTPQQNGVAERKNKTLIEAAKTMLADSFLPNTFWAEVVSTACYVLNRFEGKSDEGFLVRPKSKNVKVRVNTEESAVKPEPKLKNTIGCNLNPSDGPGKPNSITMKTVKTLKAQS